MFEGRQPVFFQRDQHGEMLLVAPNTEATLAAMRKLAAYGHIFSIGRYEDVVIVEQGNVWHKVTAKDFLPRGWKREKHLVMAGGHDSIRDVCAKCPREWKECGGPTITSPEFSGQSFKQRTALDALREAVVREVVCPLYVDGQVIEGTIERRHLRVLGLEPVSSVKAFVHNDSFGEDDHEQLVQLKSKGVKLNDYARVCEEGNSIYVDSWASSGGFPRRRWSRETTSIGDLMFEPRIVDTNLMVAKVRGGYAQSKKDELNSYRRQNCDNCVYSCPLPPWSLDRPKPLTREQVIAEYQPNADDLDWMAVFTVLGERAKFKSDRSGRRRVGVGSMPVRLKDGTWGVDIRLCQPGYEIFAERTVGDYWAEAHADSHEDYRDKYMNQKPKLSDNVDVETLALAHWALRKLADLTSHGSARFYEGGRMKYNSVLYMSMVSSCQGIEIGSDTGATRWGGYMSRGSYIKAEERPRFHTHYHTPFFESIWEWFLDTPGACRGREKSR